MVVMGAGPGIMQAAAEGAGPRMSLGVSIRLPFEERPNALVAPDAQQVEMKYFFTRKLMLVKESRGFICLPGGFGTLDEMFELLTLHQTGRMAHIPLILFGKAFWHTMINFEALADFGTIAPEDVKLLHFVDTADEAWQVVGSFYELA